MWTWEVTSFSGKYTNPSKITFGGFRVTGFDPGKPDVSRKRYRVDGERMVERTETRESAFAMQYRDKDFIQVAVQRMAKTRQHRSFSMFPGISWSSDEGTTVDITPEWEKEERMNAQFLTAELSLTLENGATPAWTVLLEDSYGETEYYSGAMITNGARTIQILPYIRSAYVKAQDDQPVEGADLIEKDSSSAPLQSIKDAMEQSQSELQSRQQLDPKDVTDLPAVGFEFFEGEASLGALHFIKTDLFKRQSVIRLRRDLDMEEQLVLAATMVLLLHMGYY